MFLFKSIDEKIEEMGFKKTNEDKYGVEYERYSEKYKYTQRVSILHKASGRHILQSYDTGLFDSKGIGNTCVGLSGYEMKLFYKKMKQMGYVTKGV